MLLNLYSKIFCIVLTITIHIYKTLHIHIGYLHYHLYNINDETDEAEQPKNEKQETKIFLLFDAKKN